MSAGLKILRRESIAGKLYESCLSSLRHQFLGCIASNIITIGDTDFQKLLSIRVNGPMHSLENFEFLNHKNYVIHRVSVSYSLAQLIVSWLFQ